MAYIHYCNKFKSSVKKENDKYLIYNKIEVISKRDDLGDIGNINKFASGIYILKSSNPKRRIIIEAKTILIDDQYIKVFFIRDIILEKKFDNEYGRILYGKLQNGDWLNANPLSIEDQENFKIEYKNIRKEKPVKLNIPPENMTKWLDDFKLELNNEIFETQEWVRYALDNCETTGMPDKKVDTFRIVLEEISKNSIESKIVRVEDDIEVLKYENHNIGILYSTINITNKTIIVLFNGAILDKQSEYWKKSITKIQNNSIEIKNTLESISRNSYRSYPKWTTSNDDLWFAIEKSKEISNLSLTSEQSSFFREFKFPYYINGQAGSGKSTMLYYLFANVCLYKSQGDIEGNIVFLTENNKLLEDTKKYVYDLLSNNPEFNILTDEQKNNSKNNFNSFKDFLFDMLDESDKSKFEKYKYLDFSLFKILYEESRLSNDIKKKYSAEESWFTIITYIYGYNLKETVKSENYEITIPRDSQVISLDKFKGIEKNIVPFYEKLLEDGYWDKLKIIRYINDNIYIDTKNKYSVIVCDEAQDFCRVELEFILSMSEYLEYDLSSIQQVPVVFAGDPNQTVNPTGFRQDEMTSLLYSQLKKIEFEYDKASNLYNPSLNYRSAQPVVTLANFIQYYRVKELGIKQKKPQEAKSPIENIDFNISINYEDIESNSGLKDDLIQKLKYKIFIVPIDYQEKDDYIKNSHLLSQIENAEVKTSVEAKGAEYKQVVLYGFGEYFLNKFKTLSFNKDDDGKFKIGYFFNKLYVAITRAQTELLIIDSKNAQEKFWKNLVDNVENINQRWDLLDGEQSKTIEYSTDSINSILVSTAENALENAQEDKKQGEYHNNPARLRVASNQFFRLGKDKEAYECLAIADEIKNNYKGAGEYYLKIDNIEKASMSFFKGRFFDDVEKIGNNLKTIKQDMRMIIARVMDREIPISKEIDVLSKNKKNLYSLIKDLSWRGEATKSFILVLKKIEENELKREFVYIVKYIALSIDIDTQKELAMVYYDLNDYKEAVDIWESIDIYEEPYYTSKLELSKDIVKKYKRDKQILDNDEAFNIYISYIYVESLDEIVAIGRLVEERFKNNLDELEEFYQNIVQIPTLKKRIFLYLLERWAKIYYTIDKNKIEELNNIYKQFNKDIAYKAFTKNELENISDAPRIKTKNNIEHFSNITIKNFRQFKNIEVEDIGQFNLILGDNNVGKTSLIEGLLFSMDIDLYFKNLIFAYASRVNSLDFKNPNDFIMDIINKDSQAKEIEFKLKENRKEEKFKIKIPTVDEVKNHYKINEDIDVNKYICIVLDDKVCDMKSVSLILEQSENTDLIQTQFIPFGKGFDKDVVKVYAENIDRNREKRKEFLESMKVFIPNIDRISIDTDEGKVYIEETHSSSDAPLHQYGEGAKKLFRILVQITLQKGKKLLIDEIDAGIHYSHFNEFWKVVLKVAKLNNVQIFATTHNMECIQYFKEVLEEEEMESYQGLSRTITLRELPNGRIKAYTRTFEEFEYELNQDLEIRGGNL